MADILSIISGNFAAVAESFSAPKSKYVNVEPKAFEGAWSGTYSTKEKFKIEISNVIGFRAKAKYQSGTTIKFQDVLIRDNSFKIGDSKFTLTRAGVAQVKTIVINPATGATVLNTASAKQNV